MSSEKQNEPSVDVLGAAQKLALIIKEDPEFRDDEICRRGEKLLDFFEDKNFEKKLEKSLASKLKGQKLEVVQAALIDLADRGKILSQSFMGVRVLKNKTQTFVCNHGKDSEGQVIYMISLKDLPVFLRWRNSASPEITEEDINSAIYRLTAEWALFI